MDALEARKKSSWYLCRTSGSCSRPDLPQTGRVSHCQERPSLRRLSNITKWRALVVHRSCLFDILAEFNSPLRSSIESVYLLLLTGKLLLDAGTILHQIDGPLLILNHFRLLETCARK